MAGEQMMKIGDVTLGMAGPAYEKLSRWVGREWAEQSRIGRENALQLTGNSQENMIITGTIYGLFNDLGIGQVKKLEAAMELDQPLLVIDGTGRKYGYFVITDLQEDQTNFISNGAPQKQEFTLTLKAYGEDQLQPDATSGYEGDFNDRTGLRV